MKIIAWNINGIRSLLKTKYLDDLIETEDPDVFCMGEIKISYPYVTIENEIKKRFPAFKYAYWNPCKTRGGYSGSAILCKKLPINIVYGLKYDNIDIDDEGRIITIEYDTYYILHVYTPNSGEALQRLEWRVNTWDIAFRQYIAQLQQYKPIIVCGDLNVAATEIDLKNPKTNLKSAGYTKEERESFSKLLSECNLIDSYRKLYPNKIEYSYWSYMRKCRDKNIGWRIDYFLTSNSIKNKVKDSTILTNVYGSDHAPIKLIL